MLNWLFSLPLAQIPRGRWEHSDVAFHYWRQLAQVLEPRLTPVPWYHLGSVPRGQASGAGLQGSEWGCTGELYQDEPTVHQLLPGEDSAGTNRGLILQ